MENKNNKVPLFHQERGAGSAFENDIEVLARTEADELKWHTKQFERQVLLRKKTKNYVSGFTVHGLTKVFVGERAESMFWSIILLSGTVLTVIVVYGLIVKFLKFGVYTEVRSTVTDENLFPAVTFCEQNMFKKKYYSYCGVPGLYPVEEKHREMLSKACDYNYNKTTINQINTDDQNFWTNGYFNITSCWTWNFKPCISQGYFKEVEHFEDACIRFNYAGNLSDLYSHVDIKFTYAHSNYNEANIIAFVHDHRLLELDQSQRLSLQSNKDYEIKMEKTVIKRLAAPYPSRCSNNKANDIFPGIYSRFSCILSHVFIGDYKICGDSWDYPRSYIPAEVKRLYKRNESVSDIIRCLNTFRREKEKLKDICPFPCNELELKIMPEVKERKEDDGQHDSNSSNSDLHSSYHIGFQYQSVDTYNVMEEKALYSWKQLACEIGGFLGLVIGASILSVVEIIVYLVLVILKKIM